MGKTEEQLRKEGIAYKVGRMPFSENERAVANGNGAGLVKLLVDTQGKILGGHILGSRADDLLAPVIMAMQANLPLKDLAATIFDATGWLISHMLDKRQCSTEDGKKLLPILPFLQ